MKVLKYIIAIALVAALAVTVIYERRDNIARDVANSLLAGTGLTVIDVALDTLTASRVIFASLELGLDDGTRMLAERIEAPLEFPSLNPEHVAIERLTVIPGNEDRPPSPIAPAVRSYVELPARFPSTALTVGEIRLPGLPAIVNLVWASADEFQRLHFRAGDYTIDTETGRADRYSHRLRMTVAGPADDDSLHADFAIIDQGGEVQVNAYGNVDLSAWLPALRATLGVPTIIEDLQGTLFGMADIRLDSERPGRIAVVLNVASDEKIGVQTSLGDGQRFDLLLPVNRPSELRFDWPYTGWSLRSPESRWSTNIDGLETLPVRLSDLDCSDEIVCNLDAAIGPGTLSYAGYKVDRAMLTLPLTVRPGDTTRVELSREPSVILTGITGDSVSIGAIDALGVGAAHIDVGEDGVTAALERATLNFSTMTAGEATLGAFALRFADLRADETGVRAGFRAPANAGKLLYKGLGTRLPASAGNVSWQNGTLRLDATFEDDEQSLSGAATVVVDENGAGQLTLRSTRLDFGARHLREMLDGIETDIDLVAGTATVTASLAFGAVPDSAPPVPAFDVALDALAARYSDIAATGIDGRLSGSLGADGLMLGESEVTAGLVDVGLPLTDLSVRFRHETPERLAVEALDMSLLGGRLAADPFIYDADQERHELLLRPRGIQLPFMAELAGFESLDVEGSLNGAIPVTVTKDKIMISKGRLDNEPPGGVIRFNADAVGGEAASLDIASRALRNFRFDSLSSDVEYDEDGDLVLKMRLSGVNPDMDPNQPIILNLNIENNIPELLRSLQAVRSIEDILSRESARQ